MSEQTYAGHTLAAIKAAAEAATPGPWEFFNGYMIRKCEGDACCRIAEMHAPYRHNVGIVRGEHEQQANGRLMATANPATVLAMATRIEELERELAEARHANTHAGLRAMYQRAMHDIGTARLEGWQAAREQAAKVCEETDVEQFTYCQVLHDDGPATLRIAAEAIRAMQLPAEWQCAEVAPVCGAAPNTEWKHPDGFGGGLTEPAR